LYDNWRRTREALRGIKYAKDREEFRFYRSSLRKQKISTAVVNFIYKWFCSAFNPQAFGGKAEMLDLDRLAGLGKPYYHPEIFGGEGNLEVAEALYYADSVDGFISSKPFGCMPSSGVSDGVQAKIMSMHPQLNFLSIETSGDNEVNILSRVSMLLFKAKQKMRNGTSAKIK
jgi:predicted nucleotide-binding protein (sugar kinase/HSP70/actin superfamily)